MAISDAQFRLAVGAAGLVLVLGITAVRFCGNVSLPAKPPPPPPPTGTEGQLLSRSAASPTMYLDFLSRDAVAAGVKTPTLEDMSRTFAYRVDESRQILEVGAPPITIAGLQLAAGRDGNALVLHLSNATESDLAYRVSTQPTPNISGCTSVAPLAYNALVIAKHETETRVECVWRDGMSLAVVRVETIELSPLSAWYVSQLPPSVVGLDPRVARGHHGVQTKERCTAVQAQAVRSGLDRGEIGWRDLVDFYARHRCQTYQFPSTYRAFKSDGEKAIPIPGAGM